MDIVNRKIFYVRVGNMTSHEARKIVKLVKKAKRKGL